MTDITKCSNENCPMKNRCWRAQAPSNPYYQSYSNFEDSLKENEDGVKVCDAFYWYDE